MGKPMMIQLEDDQRIEQLKKKLKLKSKVEVVRSALSLLEKESKKIERVERWKKASKALSQSGLDVQKEFIHSDRFSKIP